VISKGEFFFMETKDRSIGLVIAILVLIALCFTFIMYMIISLSDASIGFFGAFLLAIGVPHMVFYKKIGRHFFLKTQKRGLQFWALIGERNLQFFYRGVGIIMTIAGCILLVAGAFVLLR
jgi:hypothetical protein